MPDKTDKDPGDSTELEVAQPAAVAVTGQAPVQGELVVVGDERPTYGDAAQWEVVRRIDTGPLVLATLPIWDANRSGDLTYLNFAPFLTDFLGITHRYQLESWFTTRLPKGMDGEAYCRTLFMLYVLREKSAGVVTEAPRQIAPPGPPPYPPDDGMEGSGASKLGGSGCILLVGGFAAALAVACGGVAVFKALQQTVVPEPVPVAYVPFKQTKLSTVDTDASKHTLSRANFSFLEGCGARGYVLIECREGVRYDPPAVDPTWDGYTCWYHEGSRGYSVEFGECGEAFVNTSHEKSYQRFTWDSEKDGTVKVEWTYPEKLEYRPLYPPPPSVCAVEDGVFLGPIVPIDQTDVAEDCIAHPVRPMRQ